MLPVEYLLSVVVPAASANLVAEGHEPLLYDEFEAYRAYWLAMSLLTHS
jgi:hypothetical protein